jgi:hypothetical protein
MIFTNEGGKSLIGVIRRLNNYFFKLLVHCHQLQTGIIELIVDIEVTDFA